MTNPAVFIDRDGVINYDPGNFHKINELIILPRVSQAVKILNEHNVPAIVVTNQSVVARGLITENGVNKIHKKIQNILSKDNASITKFYYCPHHSEGVIAKYAVTCNCRKPGTGMFEKAAKELNLDLKHSFVIGDSYREIEAAKALGCASIAVTSGRSEFNGTEPDYLVHDLYEAVNIIILYRGL